MPPFSTWLADIAGKPPGGVSTEMAPIEHQGVSSSNSVLCNHTAAPFQSLLSHGQNLSWQNHRLYQSKNVKDSLTCMCLHASGWDAFSSHQPTACQSCLWMVNQFPVVQMTESLYCPAFLSLVCLHLFFKPEVWNRSHMGSLMAPVLSADLLPCHSTHLSSQIGQQFDIRQRYSWLQLSILWRRRDKSKYRKLLKLNNLTG